MDNLNGQSILVFCSVALAAGYLLKNLFQLLRGTATSGCGTEGCHDCPSAVSSGVQETDSAFVPIDSLTHTVTEKVLHDE